jgi:hypothetical protein
LEEKRQENLGDWKRRTNQIQQDKKEKESKTIIKKYDDWVMLDSDNPACSDSDDEEDDNEVGSDADGAATTGAGASRGRLPRTLVAAASALLMSTSATADFASQPAHAPTRRGVLQCASVAAASAPHLPGVPPRRHSVQWVRR